MNHEIKFPVNFLEHPKADRLIARLGYQGLFYLLRLWCWAATTSPEGYLPKTAEAIARVVQSTGWPGEPAKLLEALIEIGFIDRINGRLMLHDWAEHQPYCADVQNRIERARRNGSLGGKASAEARREKFGTAQPPKTKLKVAAKDGKRLDRAGGAK